MEHTMGLQRFTQEEGKKLPQHGEVYNQYFNWLLQTHGRDKGTFIHYLHRYYQLTWDEFWQQNQEDRWRMAYRILDRLTDFPTDTELPVEVNEDLKNCPPKLGSMFWNRGVG
jgi:hypothetical protein